jgi:hypothetical protein
MLFRFTHACRIFGLSPDRETVRDLAALDKGMLAAESERILAIKKIDGVPLACME